MWQTSDILCELRGKTILSVLEMGITQVAYAQVCVQYYGWLFISVIALTQETKYFGPNRSHTTDGISSRALQWTSIQIIIKHTKNRDKITNRPSSFNSGFNSLACFDVSEDWSYYHMKQQHGPCNVICLIGLRMKLFKLVYCFEF